MAFRWYYWMHNDAWFVPLEEDKLANQPKGYAVWDDVLFLFNKITATWPTDYADYSYVYVTDLGCNVHWVWTLDGPYEIIWWKYWRYFILRTKSLERIYQQNLTADMLENNIRRIRDENGALESRKAELVSQLGR